MTEALVRGTLVDASAPRPKLPLIIGIAVASVALVVTISVSLFVVVSSSNTFDAFVTTSNNSHASPPFDSSFNGTNVWLGNGCFWERQFAYTNLETKAAADDGKFGRVPETVTSLVGYAGSTQTGDDGNVCYHNNGNSNNDYSTLGQAEVVQVMLGAGNEPAQFHALISDFFGSFSYDSKRHGMRRPDDFSKYQGDHGGAYRSLVGIPGGVNGNLYPLIAAANSATAFPMVLKAGKGGDADVFNTVYIMDSDKFPFFRGEQYHQFHSNFFGQRYPSSYLDGIFNKQKAAGRINPTGCPEDGRHHL